MGPSVRIQTMHIAVASAGMMDRTRMAFGAEKKNSLWRNWSAYRIACGNQCRLPNKGTMPFRFFFLFLTCSFSWPSGYELDLEITGKMADQRESPLTSKNLPGRCLCFRSFYNVIKDDETCSQPMHANVMERIHKKGERLPAKDFRSIDVL